jgi:hypothetical protein
MTLPLPADADFRKLCVGFWLDDVDDRLELGRVEDAEFSWKEANGIYLSLPPGSGDFALEDRLTQQRVKINNFTFTTNENNF